MFANQNPWIEKRLPSFMLREASIEIIPIISWGLKSNLTKGVLI